MGRGAAAVVRPADNGETVIVTGDLLNETKEIDVQENEIRTIY